MYEDHFQEEGIVNFEIDGAKFGYKPTSAGEENSWLVEYMVLSEKGILQQDLPKLNICKMRNLIEAPYTRELISAKIGVNKDWIELNHEERWTLLYKLKPAVFNRIINEMNQIDKGLPIEQEQKKN
jgi:hypothetical protein